MKTVNTRQLDGSALKHELYKRGVTLTMASQALGKSPGYLAVCLNKGVISETSGRLLDIKYNLNPADYTVTEEVMPEVEVTGLAEQVEALSKELRELKAILSRCIYTANKSALHDAWVEGLDDQFSRVFYEACKAAMVDALEDTK